MLRFPFILELTRAQGVMAYWVKWKGYADSDNTWVDEGDAE